jgi:hypothetical protein
MTPFPIPGPVASSAGDDVPASFPVPADAPHAPEPASSPPPLERRRAGGPKAMAIVRRLKALLKELNITVYQLSQLTSRPPFGKGTRSHIRDAFYAELESGQTPDIHQVAALARITGYRFIDWMTLFGYDVSALLSLQLRFHGERTVLLPTAVYDPLAMLPWVRRIDTTVELDRAQPLDALIDAIGYEPIGALERLNRRHYLYARVGRRDDMVRSRLAAGSIVRVDPSQTTVAPVGGLHRPIYLVQHLGGLSCCYVEQLDDDHVVLLPDDGATRVMRCRLGVEAVVLGTVDTELRRLPCGPDEAPPPPREKLQAPHRLHLFDPDAERRAGPGGFARIARERVGICFREAQTITRHLARLYDDKNYNVALGSLSDAETQNLLPRHIPKILSLCVVYGMDLWQYLRAGGVPVDELNGRPIPPQFLSDDPRTPDAARVPSTAVESSSTMAQATETIVSRLGDVPFFLLSSMTQVIGQDPLTLDDVFLWGPRERPLHPMLAGAVLLVVNRRQRRVPDAGVRQPSTHRLLYLIRLPSGQLVAGMCALDGDVLMVQPHNMARTPVLAYHTRDVEVVGRITAVVRSTSNGNGHAKAAAAGAPEPADTSRPRGESPGATMTTQSL